jgi:hypothetical protein
LTITKELVEDQQEEIELTAKDRCDSCGAQAFVYVKGLSGELYFCGHHYTKNEEKLKSWSFTTIDKRDTINKKSESSN